MGPIPFPPLPVMSEKEAREARFREEITPPRDIATPIIAWALVLTSMALVGIVIYLIARWVSG